MLSLHCLILCDAETALRAPESGLIDGSGRRLKRAAQVGEERRKGGEEERPVCAVPSAARQGGSKAGLCLQPAGVQSSPTLQAASCLES